MGNWVAEKLEVKNQPAQPINILVPCKITNTATGEVLLFDAIAHNLTEADIALQAAQRIKSVEARDTAKSQITAGPIILPDLTPTQEDKDRQAYAKFSRVAMALRATFGDNDQRTLAAVAEADAVYKPEYV